MSDKRQIDLALARKILKGAIEPLAIISQEKSESMFNWETDWDGSFFDESWYDKRSGNLRFPVKLSNGCTISRSEWELIMARWVEDTMVIVTRGDEWGVMVIVRPTDVSNPDRSAKEYGFLQELFGKVDFFLDYRVSMGAKECDLCGFITFKAMKTDLLRDVLEWMESGINQNTMARIEGMVIKEGREKGKDIFEDGNFGL